jgi:hypothetical protein
VSAPLGVWQIGTGPNIIVIKGAKSAIPMGHESLLLATLIRRSRTSDLISPGNFAGRSFEPAHFTNYHAPSPCSQSFPPSSHSALHWLRYSTYSKSATNKASRGRRKSLYVCLYDALAPPQLLTLPSSSCLLNSQVASSSIFRLTECKVS